MEKDTALYKALSASMEDREPASKIPLGPEEILAYHHGELEPDEEEAVRERLMGDRKALDSLLDLEALERGEAADGDPTASAAAGQASFLAFQKALACGAEGLPERKTRHTWRVLDTILVAACLLFGATSVLFYLSVLRLRQPFLDTTHTVHFDRVDTRSTTSDPLVLKQNRQSIVLRLPHQWREYPSYAVEIFTEKEGLLWRQDIAGPISELSLVLDRTYFPGPGTYRVNLAAAVDGQLRPLTQFPLIIAAQ